MFIDDWKLEDIVLRCKGGLVESLNLFLRFMFVFGVFLLDALLLMLLWLFVFTLYSFDLLRVVYGMFFLHSELIFAFVLV